MAEHRAQVADGGTPAPWTGTDAHPPCAVQLHALENAVVVVASGDLDLYTTPPFRRVLLEAIENEPSKRLAVDLRGVGFVDSAGFAALVEAQKQLVKRGRSLGVLMAPKGQPMRVFSLMGFASFMTLLPSLDALI